MRWWRRAERANDDGRWRKHYARAGAVLAELESLMAGEIGISVDLLDRVDAWRDRAAAQPPEVIGSTLMLLLRRHNTDEDDWWVQRVMGPLHACRLR